MSNVLDLYDQTTFIGERATGTTNLLQCIWVYDRTIDIDGLRRFYQHLQRGRLSRRIEPSPLPFGRHRWVSASNQCTLEIVETPRPREEFDAWLGEQTNKVLDPERGPEWHLAVLPFTDGGAGVSLVISHCLTDGVGLCEALADAACGRTDPINWPAAGARPLWQALLRGRPPNRTRYPRHRPRRRLRSALRPAQPRQRGAGHPPPVLSASSRRTHRVPEGNDLRRLRRVGRPRTSLGGTSNSLLAGFAAHLAQRMGRVTADGSVDLTLPVNEREAGDTRANAITNVDFTVDPDTGDDGLA